MQKVHSWKFWRSCGEYIENLRGIPKSYVFMGDHPLMKARISTDLGDPRLLKLLKIEAQDKDTTVWQVLICALEAYFAERLDSM